MTAKRYTYASYATWEKATTALLDALASGEISLGEGPRIERHGRRFIITLQGE